MATDRRIFLRLGAGAVVAIAAGDALSAAQAAAALPEGDAFAPWRLWNDPAVRNTPLSLVSCGVLAANPHDTQAWSFRVGDDFIEVYADAARNLGAMDPYLREMRLGIGCAVENMLTAAGPNGYAAQLEVRPGALTEGGEPAARLKLSKLATAVSHSRFAAIPNRHTNRYAYDRNRALPGDWLEYLREIGAEEQARTFVFETGAARTEFDAQVVDATQAIIDDAEMIADSDRWFRDSAREVDLHRDGPTLDAAGLSTLTLAFARLFPVSPSTSHRAWLDQTRTVQIASAPVVGFIAVRDRYDRAASVAAGRVWQRLHLEATLRGIAMQPLNQAVEMIDRERQRRRAPAWADRLARLTGPEWQATFAFRAGYCSTVAPASPRRRLRDVVAT